ncbi:unnamed protein product [Fraxinus pennsylvanica]|uniref:Uncharacterized protein n=1 Tax=Fraxinus pennsylvanica TaxID=56036 RepID=A0AAD2AF87_9LAMI|nr:unnamed protein product [Fraxinus pennsylvanica]
MCGLSQEETFDTAVVCNGHDSQPKTRRSPFVEFTVAIYSSKGGISSASPDASSVDNWCVKAIRRKIAGTGRMRYLCHVLHKFKTNLREGSQAAPRKKGAAASA